jgi:hypothetical protein
MTLDPEDLTKFWKKLRKYNKKLKIKYYAAGEYGEKYYRPHYHAIVFNIEDYNSIGKAWELGSIDIGTVSGSSIAYTCKYIDKKQRIPLHKDDDRIPEFSRMSRGLGKNYITKQIIKYHKNDLSRNYVTNLAGIRIPMPRYYRNRIYDQFEQARQRSIMEKAFEEQREKQYKEYLKYYGKNDMFTFEAYQESMILGKNKAFYQTKKLRL